LHVTPCTCGVCLPTCLTRMTKSNKALSYLLTKLEVKRAYYVIVRCYMLAMALFPLSQVITLGGLACSSLTPQE